MIETLMSLNRLGCLLDSIHYKWKKAIAMSLHLSGKTDSLLNTLLC